MPILNQNNLKKPYHFFQGSSDSEFQFIGKFIQENEITSVIGSHDKTSWSILPWSYKIINLRYEPKKIRLAQQLTIREIYNFCVIVMKLGQHY